MDMKVSGMYIARQLSFSGVTFRIEEIPLSPAFQQVYNRAARLVSWAVVCTCWHVSHSHTVGSVVGAEASRFMVRAMPASIRSPGTSLCFFVFVFSLLFSFCLFGFSRQDFSV